MIPDVFDALDAPAVMRSFANDLLTVDFHDAFEACVETVNSGFEENFDEARAPDGPWKPHAPLTILLHGVHPLLILSGKMKASVTQRGTEERVENIGARDAAFGTDLFYAGYQQFGTMKIPARRFLWLGPVWVDAVTEKFSAVAFQILIGV